MSDDPRTDLKGTGYELFMLLLSLLSIANAVIVILTGPASVGHQVAFTIEVAITPFFLSDFVYRLLSTRSKRRYLVRRWGWADLLAIVPFLRVFRLVRIYLVVREGRRVGRERLAEDLFVSRASTTFLFTVFLVIAVVEFAGMAEYYVEQGVPNANIVSAGDSIWWGLVTITTVGYGDQYPVGEGGRLVGTILLFAGIGLFSVLTGFIANFFLAPDLPRRRARLAPGTPAAEMAALHELLAEQERQHAAVRAKLHDLERSMLSRTREGGANPARAVDGS
ncbi:MAG TPA: ion transporter [Candidatus Limnocylindrales bacterium]